MRNKRADLTLALHDDAESGGLDAAGGEAVADLLPDETREIVSDESVEDAAGFLSFAEILVDVAGILHCFHHGVFRDLVENNSLRERGAMLAVELGCLGDVPSDRFSFSVGVGREDDFIGTCGEGADLSDDGFLPGADDIVGDEASSDVDGFEVALRKVSDVSDRSLDGVFSVEIF